MVINNNLAAMSSSDNLSTAQSRLAQSLARISSGSKIVQPGDDAAGLAMGTRLDAQIHRIAGAKSNVANATSFVQTQDGYLKKVGKALDRMSELSILAQDATKSDPDRELYNKEFSELKDYIKTAADKEFNGVTLFSATTLDVTIDSEGGSFDMKGIDMLGPNSKYAPTSLGSISGKSKLSELGMGSPVVRLTEGTILLGSGSPIVISKNDTIEQVFARIHEANPNLTASLDPASGKVTIANASGSPVTLTQTGTNLLEQLKLPSPTTITAASASTSSSGVEIPGSLDILTVDNAAASLTAIKAAITQLASDRATIGSYQARLSYTSEQLSISKENLTAASSRIQDVDIADESTEYAKANIMVQSGTAMLAQANQLPQQVLRLLQ